MERVSKEVVIEFAGNTIARTRSAWRVLETSHPPVCYLPPDDIRMEWLEPVGGTSICEWKGVASYYSLNVGGRKLDRAAWTYHEPTALFAPIKDHIAFYPGPLDGCYIDGEKARPQAGSFYGGWITNDIVGPFKGKPGTEGW
jgi:uncharacterized protein (DUF427 family)